MLKCQVAVGASKYSSHALKAILRALVAVISMGISSAPIQAVQPIITPQATAQHETSYDPIAGSGDWCNG
jgi:hypothetical protein